MNTKNKSQEKIFSDLEDLAKHFRDLLNNQNIILLYAYNGVGKTRLSMAFKDIAKRAGTGDTLYFNAFTEDLFSWDNDLERDSTRRLKMNLQSKFFEAVKDYPLEEKIRVFWRCFSDIDFEINYTEGSISFSKGIINGTVENIKISRGEESIFVWCFFLAIVQLVLDADDGYSWVKHIYIDDPISSLDDNNAIAVAVQLATLLAPDKKVPKAKEVKVIISTHHALFFNALCNCTMKMKRHCQHLKREGESYSLSYSSDTPRFLHVAMLEELWRQAESGDLYTYHFGMLRNILERSASFHGHKNFSECFITDEIQEDSALYSRVVNILTHGNTSLYEPIVMLEDNKKLFKKVLEAFIKNYKFNSELFSSTQEDNPPIL